MDIDSNSDMSDIDIFLREAQDELERNIERIGKEAVDYAVANGTYHDVTGTLRRSNKFKVEDGGLILYNDAKSPSGEEYAEKVEQRGLEVLSGAILYAEKRLKEEFE